MAEYNTNPYDTNPKPMQAPLIIQANNQNQKLIQIKQPPINQTINQLHGAIRNQQILIIQDQSKLKGQEIKRKGLKKNSAQAQLIGVYNNQVTFRKKRKPLRFSQPVRFYPSNTYIYPYYYDSSGCYYCCCLNGNCFPCTTCHDCYCSPIICDPFPCCNGCNGFHCGCLQCLPLCQHLECVQQNNCQCCCQFLPCCSGCEFCSQACDGTCLSAIPCCNNCQYAQICSIIPCCNGCQFQPLFGCLPCCNEAICNICECLNGCQLFNCYECCGNGFQCVGNCDCGNCDCNSCDCNGCDCNGCDLGGCDC